MFILNRDEFVLAIGRAEKKHGVDIEPSLAELLLEKVADLKEGHAFVDAIRFALNGCKIWDDKRPAYRSLIGFYFGPHGGRVRARRVRRARKKPPKTVEVILEPDGQFTFRI